MWRFSSSSASLLTASRPTSCSRSRRGRSGTDDGSRADLDYRPFPAVWDAVQSEDGNCLGKQCPRHAACFFYAARRRAQNANILIVNHAALRHRSSLARGRLRPAARLRSRDHRRGAYAGIGRRRAPGAEGLKPRRRLHAVSAL